MIFMNTIDLQVHSTASDGRHSPSEVVAMAKEMGVQVISLTDHDTVAGLPEALAAGQELGVKVIPGSEISAEEHGIHVLGYGVDYKNAELLAVLEEARKNRIEGAKKMVENLQKDGWVVDWEDVLKEVARATVIARPHIARAVLHRPENKEKLDGITLAGDFIEAHLIDTSPNYVKRSHIDAAAAIKLINNAGGVAIWSHPPLPDFQDGEERHEELEKFLRQLVGWGMEGLEVFNSAHTEDDAEFLLGLAIKYNLLQTAGSDFHEKSDLSSSTRGASYATSVGGYEAYGFSTEDIVFKLEETIKHRRV